jgi:glycosyltransferase domain-containing protein
MPASPLTIVLPTRNRAHNLPGQLQLLARMAHPLVVADSSDEEQRAQIRAMADGAIAYQTYPATLTLFHKLARVAAGIDTPYVLLVSDRKITLAHAIERLLGHMIEHPGHVAAAGYIVGFGKHADLVDINRVIWFTPTIGESDPLQRHYHLMRRYQSWQFSLFRTECLVQALALAVRVDGAVFQEIAFMNAMALQGVMARLPLVLTLQSQERSFHPPKRNDPFYWYLDDAASFFAHYARYRQALAEYIIGCGVPVPSDAPINQVLDMIHGVWLHRNFNNGVMNHATRLLLGDSLPPLPLPGVVLPWREPADGDIVRAGRSRRSYIWRREVIRAQPRHEITITQEEIDRVNEQLDIYFAASPAS